MVLSQFLAFCPYYSLCSWRSVFPPVSVPGFLSFLPSLFLHGFLPSVLNLSLAFCLSSCPCPWLSAFASRSVPGFLHFLLTVFQLHVFALISVLGVLPSLYSLCSCHFAFLPVSVPGFLHFCSCVFSWLSVSVHGFLPSLLPLFMASCLAVQFVCSPVPSLFTTLLSLYISHLTLCSFALGTPYNTCTEGMFLSVIGTKISYMQFISDARLRLFF